MGRLFLPYHIQQKTSSCFHACRNAWCKTKYSSKFQAFCGGLVFFYLTAHIGMHFREYPHSKRWNFLKEYILNKPQIFRIFEKKIDLSNCLVMDFWEQCNQYITDLSQHFPADRVIPALIYIGKQVRRAKIHSSLSTCGDWFLYRAYICTQALWACLAAFRLLFHTGDGLISPSSKATKWAIQTPNQEQTTLQCSMTLYILYTHTL